MKEYNGKPLVEGLLEEIKHVYRSDVALQKNKKQIENRTEK